MRLLDLTLPTAAENIALDEALLEEAESRGAPTETLRFWESPQPLVVVGRSSQIEAEVRIDACRASQTPILRRVSGGAAVVAGPGCLMYALVLSYHSRPQLRSLTHAHRYVLGMLAAALEPWAPGVQCLGTSDLAIAGRKFSGNSARCRRHHLLYHGTLLYNFPLEWIDRWLTMPPRMPDYRDGRPHGGFVTNLVVDVATIRHAIKSVWQAEECCDDWPRDRTAMLVAEKYSQPDWSFGSGFIAIE